MSAAFMTLLRRARRRARAGIRGGGASRAPRPRGRRSRIARSISPCWRRIASPSIEAPIVSISDGCSTSSVQLVNARRISFPAVVAITRWKRVSAIRNASDGGMVPLGLGDRRLQVRRGLLGRVLRGEPRERHLEVDARVDQLVQRDAVGLEHRRDRLADVPAHPLVLRALDEDAAARSLRGPDQVRAREQPQPLAQGRPADPELGRELLLGPEALAGPRPRAET